MNRLKSPHPPEIRMMGIMTYKIIFDFCSILNCFVYSAEEQGAYMVLCFAADWAAAVDSAAIAD